MTTEKDPNGLDPHKPGAKLDAGKPRVGLMFKGFARALLRVAEVTTFGANKYTPNGWESVDNGQERYLDASARHLLQGFIEPRDPQTNIEHLAHEAWNALARLELALRKAEGLKGRCTDPVKMSPGPKPPHPLSTAVLAANLEAADEARRAFNARTIDPAAWDSLGIHAKDDML